MEKKFDYAEAIAQLENIAAKVEDPTTPLDDMDRLLKESSGLVEQCRKYLRSARESLETQN